MSRARSKLASDSQGMELVASSGGQLASTSSSVASKPNKATARSVPAFLNKLYSMVSDPQTEDLIHWNDEGDSFFITSADRVAKELLPRFFKHSNFGSFVRQLNMYGFHKVPHLQQGVLKKDDEGDLLEFTNPNFARGQPDLLCLIRRQKAKAGEGTGENGALDIPTLLTDLTAIRKHQTAISADLKELQERNHALWQEAVSSREKHKRQEETINKILRFLAGVFGGQVLDSGGSGGGGGVEATSPSVGAANSASPPESSSGVMGGGGGSGSGSGKGKATAHDAHANNGVAVIPRRARSRLLLEDVKGRQAERAEALRELDGSEEEEIEEIPLLHEEDDGLPTISSSFLSPNPPPTSSSISRPSMMPHSSSSLTIANSPARSASPAGTISNRFTAIPTPSPLGTPYEPPHNFSGLGSVGGGGGGVGGLNQDTINALLQAAGNNPEALTAFLSQQQANNNHNMLAAPPPPPPASSAAPPYDYSQSLIPISSSSSYPLFNVPSPSTGLDLTSFASAAPPSSHNPSASSSLAPFSPSLLSTEYADNNAAISSLSSESYDIHQRTAALENQIKSLMDSLPEGAREQVENGKEEDGQGLGGIGGGMGMEGLGGEFDWGTITGEDGQLDLDKMLAQFTDSSSKNVSDFSSSLPSTVHGSNTLPPPSFPTADSTVDFSSFLNSPQASTSTSHSASAAELDPSLSGLSASGLPPLPASINSAYEVTSPADSFSGLFHGVDMASPASTVASEPGVSSGGGAKKNGGVGGRKRKSDVLGADSPGEAGPDSPAGSEAGGATRRSARKRKA